MIHVLLVASLALSVEASPPFEAPLPPQDPPPQSTRPENPPAGAAPAGAAETGSATTGGAKANAANAGKRDPATAKAAPLDAVQLIINDYCITFGDLQQQALQEGKPPATREEYVQRLSESADKLTRDKLMEQAGRDLGYDPKLIQGAVRNSLKDVQESYGSVAALAEDLERHSFDSQQFEEDREDAIYRSLWQEQITGKAKGPGGRAYVDRYVRPGQILLEFQRRGSTLDLPATVQLDEMIIAPDLGETPESARQKAELVRSRLRNGEDFYELNATYGIPGRDPELDPIPESKLAAIPEVKDFVDGAAPGEFSPAFPILHNGQLAGFRILRFVARQEGKAASFVDRQFQEQLAAAVLERRSKLWEARALRRLHEAAYIWPPELARRSDQADDVQGSDDQADGADQPATTPDEPAAQGAKPQGGTPEGGS